MFDAINAVNTGTNIYAMNRQTPAPVLQAVQQGFKQAVVSQAFVADMQKRQLLVGYKSPEDVAANLQTLNSAPPAQKVLLGN